jgi:site-specific recombinase XerD
MLFSQIGSRESGWVFPNPRYREKRLKSQALTAAWRRAARKAGISDDVDLYCARHTFGTDVMKATKSPFLVSKLMGPSDLSITGRYQHHGADDVAALMNQSKHGA